LVEDERLGALVAPETLVIEYISFG